MDFLNKLFSSPIFKRLKETEELFEIESEDKCFEENAAKKVADDYFRLIKHLHKKEKSYAVMPDPEDHYIFADDLSVRRVKSTADAVLFTVLR